MRQELKTSILTKKEIAWESIKTEVEAMSDSLGRPVDERIKEAVTAIKAHGFPTIQSCEGHPSEEGESKYPWVMVSSPEYEGWRENEDTAERMIAENLGYQRKMIGLLSEFYEDQNSPFDAHLTFEVFGPTWGFKMKSNGADVTRILNHAEREEKLILYRKEMNAFADFLKNKFFSE